MLGVLGVLGVIRATGVTVDFEAVEAAMRHAHATAIAPRFRALADGEVEEKSPGEMVTVADRDCEELLAPLLREIVDAPVVGEERASADPSIIGLLESSPAAWLVDPIDGTSNFAGGSPDYAVMVAFVEGGEPTAAWILQPEHDVMLVAAVGAGATRNAEPVQAPQPDEDPSRWLPVIKDRFLPPDARARVERAIPSLGPVHQGGHCAGIEYPGLISGRHSLLLYWRTLPWDHAPGVLFADEAGCVALRPDGARFSITDGGEGLLVCHRSIAADALELLLGPEN